ncbi:MAG: molybdate ABC transporter substrate-binding protein [Pseudomonadota bacterium]
MWARAFILLLALIRPVAAEDGLVVFAAASLGGALDEVARQFPSPVTLTYAGSATLARQVAAGAPADVVVLAHEAWMDFLADAGAVGPAQPILSNRLVIAALDGAVATDPVAALTALPDAARLATGLVDAVPVGIYTREALTALDLWAMIAPRLVQTENARIALSLAHRGEVAAAIIYQSDAAAAPALTVIARFAPELHAPIRYPAAITSRARDPSLAAAFLAHLQSDVAQAIFAEAGFETAP